MSEPASGTVGSVALATGSITLTGAIFGLNYDALLCGLFGGLISLMHLEMQSKYQTFVSLAAASVSGAMFSPVAVAAGLNYADWLAKVSPENLRMAAAGAIGVFGQPLIPVVLRLLKSRAGKAEG